MALQQSSIQILPALVGKTLNPARDGRCEMGRFGAFASSLARGLGAEKYHRAVQPLAAYGAFCRERAPGGALFQQEHLFVQIRLFFAMLSFMGRWCTVTVTDGDGKRYSLDINANSSYDAAHLYLTHVTAHPGCGLPIPTTTTTFEVIADGKVFHVQGARLKRWIEKRREEWNGPRGLLFKQRPIIGD